MKVRCVHYFAHHARDEMLSTKISQLWDQGSDTVEQAISRSERTIYGGDPKGPRLNTQTGRIKIHYCGEAFIFLGGRASIGAFLTEPNNEYTFEAGFAEKLGLVTIRKRELLGKNKTLVAVCNTGWRTKNPITPVASFVGGGTLPLDVSGKALSFRQLASILTVMFHGDPVKPKTEGRGGYTWA